MQIYFFRLTVPIIITMLFVGNCSYQISAFDIIAFFEICFDIVDVCFRGFGGEGTKYTFEQ